MGTVRGPDRRQAERRAAEQRIHLARELVVAKAVEVADSYESPNGLDIEALEAQVELVAVLRSAQADAEAVPR